MSENRKLNKKNNKNYSNRFTAILLTALIVNLGLYWLPKSIGGLSIKKVDLLSDIRELPEDNEDEDLMALLAGEDASGVRSRIAGGGVNPGGFLPDTSLRPPVPLKSAVRPYPKKNKFKHNAGVENLLSLNKTNLDAESETNVENRADDKYNTKEIFGNTQIEDFSLEHTSLRHFFAALNNIKNLGRPVRVAFVGDSFIEGDIVVADFRAKMQARFGGRGVGFVPVTSQVAQFRPTIKQSSDGWKTYSLIYNKKQKYTLSGMVFEPVSGTASIRFHTVNMYPGLEEVSSLKFIYSKNNETEMILKSDDKSVVYKLPSTDSIMQYDLEGNFTSGTLQFRNAEGLKALGIALEDNDGVVVDNFSLRGNSGLIMSEIDGESCRELQKIRPYDLIVLQYGLNVANDSIRDYGWYQNRMISVIGHLKYCFPGADILMLGVSDRSHKHGDSYSTMPAVLALLRAQRQTAQHTEVAFWSIFAAMGGPNSMVKYVKYNWASKDYTHLSFRGGREVANALYDAIINEKGTYDGEEKLVDK